MVYNMSMYTRLWFFILASIVVSPFISCQSRVKSHSIEELVEGLASGNPSPRKSNSGSVQSLPRDYTSEKQVIVQECVDNLITRGTEAFPALIDRLKDDRYCCLEEFAEPKRVGDVCYFLLHSQVRPWPSRLFTVGRYPLGPGKPYTIPHWNEDISAWWDARRRMSLLELQKEAVKTSIDFIIQSGEYPTGSPYRDECLEGLHWCSRYLERIGKPIPICVRWQFGDGDNVARKGEPILPLIATPAPIINASVIELIGMPPFDTEK